MPRLTVVLCCVVLLVVTAGSAAAETFSDPAGDTSFPGGAAGSDLIGIDITQSGSSLNFQARFAPGTLGAGFFFALPIDADRNPATGEPFLEGIGADFIYYTIRFDGNTLALAGAWDEFAEDYNFEPVDPPAIAGDSISFSLPSSAVGSSFNFRVIAGSVSDDPGAEPSFGDYLPDLELPVATFGGGVAPQPPTVLVFTASPNVIAAGQSTTLSWRTSAGSSVNLSDVGDVSANGSAVVTPTQTTTYTLTATTSGGTARAQVTVNVVAVPLLVVSGPPQGITQIANAGGGTDSIVVTNIGGGPATVQLTTTGGIFTVSPQSFTIGRGESVTITLTGTPRPAGVFTGTVTVTGAGFPPLTVRVSLLSAAPSDGAVPRSATSRVEVNSEGTTTGTVRFTNNGTNTLQAMAVSDVPWITPESGVITIAPGGSRDVSFTVNPSLRSVAVGSESAEISLVYISGSASTPFKGGGNQSQSLSVTLVHTKPPLVSAGGIPALPTGETAFFVPGLTRAGSLVTDLVASNRGGSGNANLNLYYVGVSSPASGARTTSFSSVGPGNSITLVDAGRSVFPSAPETGTLQIRSSQTGLGVAATLFNKSRQEGLLGTSLVALRADRGFSAPTRSYINGLRADGTASTSLYLQEMGGTDASVKVDFLSTSGVTLGSRTENIPAFGVIELPNIAPSGAVAAMLTSLSGGRIAGRAIVRNTDSGDLTDVVDWNLRNGIGASQPQAIPFARGGSGSSTQVVITNRGEETMTGTLSFVGAGGSRRRVVGRRNSNGGLSRFARPLPPSSDANVNISLEPSQSRVIETTELGANGVGMILYQPLSGVAAVSARTTTATTFGAISTSLPVVGAAAGLRLGDSREFSSIESASRTASLTKRPGSFQSSLGLVETAGRDVRVRATLRYTQSAPGAIVELRGVAARDYAVSARQFVRLGDLAREIIGPQRESFDDLRNVRLEITVIEGDGAVVPMIALTENGTGDVIVRME